MSISHPVKYAQKLAKIRASQKKLLDLLGRLDKHRGCFARREKLAEMTGYSIHTINSDISLLKRGGLLRTASAGQRRDSPSIIRLTAEGKYVLQKLQAEYKESRPHDKEYHVQKNPCTKQHIPNSKVLGENKNVVNKHSTKPLEKNLPRAITKPLLLSDEQKRIFNKLVFVGVNPKVSRELAQQTTMEALDQVMLQAKRYRGEIWNYPGFILSALKESWLEIPTMPESKPKKKRSLESGPLPHPHSYQQHPVNQRTTMHNEPISNPVKTQRPKIHDLSENTIGDPKSTIEWPNQEVRVKKPKNLPGWKTQLATENYGEPASKQTAKSALANLRQMFKTRE